MGKMIQSMVIFWFEDNQTLATLQMRNIKHALPVAGMLLKVIISEILIL